jgi:NitT/TauT family transport system substrate-binding protein
MTKIGTKLATITRRTFAGTLAATAVVGRAARAQAPVQAPDKVKVGMFPLSSALPFYVALDLGYFKELNIEPEVTRLMGGPPNVAALITNQIEVSVVLVTLEGLNADIKKPGVAMYVSMNSQNAKYKMEQFVARANSGIKTLADFKGKKLMCSPGPANLNTAKAILAKVGLKDGDFTIDQLDQGQHVNALKGGTFDGGYTLEPSATIISTTGTGYTVEAGVIAKYILGDVDAEAYAAGCAFTTEFIKGRPDVARRFAAAMSKGIDYIRANPGPAHKHLAKNTLTPDNLVDVVSLLGYTMTKDMNPTQKKQLQQFADFGVQIGVVPKKIDISEFTVSL